MNMECLQTVPQTLTVSFYFADRRQRRPQCGSPSYRKRLGTTNPIRSKRLFILASMRKYFAIQNGFNQFVTLVGEFEGKERYILL